MSELPQGWTRASLGEMADEPEQLVPAADDTFAYIDISAIDRTRKVVQNAQQMFGKDAPSRARKKVAAGDTLVSMTRPNLNAVALVPDSLDGQIASTGFDVLRPRKGIDPRWLAYAVRTDEFVKVMSDLVQGALYPAVRSKDVRGYIAPLAPAAEQTRIADQLDTLLARIQACNDRLDAIPALLKRFRKAVLNAATSGLLTDEWRIDETTPWRQVQLADVASDFSYGSAAKSAKTGRMPVLRMGNIQDGRLDWNDLVFTSDEREIEKYALTAGDVLFNRTNSPELVGKTAVYKGERPAVYAGYLIRVRCSPDLLPDYLNYCLGSKDGRAYCWSVKSDGVSQSNINAKKLAAFPLRLPSLSEQTEIVRRVEALMAVVDRIEARWVVVAKHSQRLAPLTLAKAFRGELIQQDPNDEPASVLLQRLTNTPTAAVKAPRGRPRSKQANQSNPLPSMHPDLGVLPAGAWATGAPPDEHTTAALLIAVLKAWDEPMPQDQARLAALLCLQPRLFAAALPAQDAAVWRRLVGAEAEPLPASVPALQPAVNAPWRRALAGLRARGDLVASGSGPQDTWALGPGADRVDTTGWPDGRAGWVVAYLRAHGVEALLPLLPTAAVDFVHAHAA